MAVFEYLERELLDQNLQPLSVSPSRADIEQAMLSSWAHGEMTFMARLLKKTTPQLPQQHEDIKVGSGGWQRELSALKREIQGLANRIHTT